METRFSTLLYRDLLTVLSFSLNASIFFTVVVRPGRKAIADPDGDELAGDNEARKHAKTIAREVLDHRHWHKRGLEGWAFVITD